MNEPEHLRPNPGGALTAFPLVAAIDAPTGLAVAYLRALRPQTCRPLYIGPPGLFDETAERWREAAPRMGELTLLEGGNEHTARALRRFLRSVPADGGFRAVVVPEMIRRRSWREYLRLRATLWLKASLLFEHDVVVMDVPMLPEERADAELHAARPLEPGRSVVIMPVSGVHDGTVRAADLAASLRATTAEAVFFATDPDDVRPVMEELTRREMPLPLTVVEAPFRDIGPPLLAEVRRHTSHAGTIVTVVLPEFVVSRWWEHLLHNQTGLFVKRLLFFEPGVVLASVPYHLDGTPSVTESEPAPSS